MKDSYGNILNEGDFVVRHNSNGGWAADDCEIPLMVIAAPEDSNRKFDLLNTRRETIEHFVKRRDWQDMGASGYVSYKYEYISKERAAELSARKDAEDFISSVRCFMREI